MSRTAAVLLAFLASASLAQDPPAKLTKEALDKMIEKLGHETRPIDKTFTEVVVERGGRTTRLRASISPDGTRVWLDAWFVTVTRPEDVPAATWRRVLAKNEEVSPAAFSLNPADKRLYLSLSVPNADVTPAVLRREIEFLDGWVEKTADVWKLSNFVPAMTPEGEKELAALAGAWKVVEFADLGKPLEAEEAAKFALAIEKNTFRFSKDGKTLRSGQLVAGVGDGKKHLDRYDTGGSVRGVFKLDGDTLAWAFAPGDRPASPEADPRTKTTLLVLKREK